MNIKTIFVIGDSISLHYGPYLEEMIKGKYSYRRKIKREDALIDLDKPVGANSGDSGMVLEYLRNEYDKGIHYDILMLNCGLHDIRVDKDTKKIQVEDLQYRENIDKIMQIALKMSDDIFWITTTPVNDKIHNRRKEGFLRYNKDVILYNNFANDIMNKYKIACIDLYTFTKSLGEDIYFDHVHFTEEIRAMQGAFITGYLFSKDQD